MLALQQSLKSLVDDPSEADFERGRTFWKLFFDGPDVLIENLKTGRPQFAFEEVSPVRVLVVSSSADH